MKKIFVKPREGLRVKNPVDWQPLPPEGKKVERNTYWIRRLKAGDVIEIKEEIKSLNYEGLDNG